MIVSKTHFEEYQSTFEENASKIFGNLEDAAITFSEKYKVSKEEAVKRIENNTNADWIACPNGRVYVM